MNINFPAFLVLATFVTGVIWALDALIFAPRRRAVLVSSGGAGGVSSSEQEKVPLVVEYSKSFFPIILGVLVLRSFLVEPFRIPSGSMMPTLLVGDFILVNKFSYGLRLPVLNTKIIDIGEPQRGDVAVFRYPEDPSIDYIKRVVGVPGDHIRYAGKKLYVNGELARQELVGKYIAEGASASMTGAMEYRETLGDVTHDILVRSNGFNRDFEYTVPDGQYFVLGDNRDNSRDSRYWGTVPEGNLVGKAFFVWMNWDPVEGGITWNRIGTIIK
ncbi:MAG TPA: signal peptidase I [Gammaproteobacteria bacterium]|nr:signal peptidase I [Gammaproteobacteria bacterium]